MSVRFSLLYVVASLTLFAPLSWAQTPLPPNPETLFLKFQPYNNLVHELDLWQLEARRFVRSPAVISPDRAYFAYTEILFMPKNRQTFSRLYRVAVQPLPEPPPVEALPSESGQVMTQELPQDPQYYVNRYEPDKTIRFREELLGVGDDRTRDFEFRTLSVVDWSATGRRLLFKQRSGVLHMGLHTSDILVFDQTRGTVTIYPEVQRIVRHYWQKNSNLPDLNHASWEIYPLGWEPHSDTMVILECWAYDHQERKFLGLWRYDVEAERAELISLKKIDVPVASNGLLAEPVPNPPQPKKKKKKKKASKLP